MDLYYSRTLPSLSLTDSYKGVVFKEVSFLSVERKDRSRAPDGVHEVWVIHESFTNTSLHLVTNRRIRKIRTPVVSYYVSV